MIRRPCVWDNQKWIAAKNFISSYLCFPIHSHNNMDKILTCCFLFLTFLSTIHCYFTTKRKKILRLGKYAGYCIILKFIQIYVINCSSSTYLVSLFLGIWWFVDWCSIFDDNFHDGNGNPSMEEKRRKEDYSLLII